MACPYFYPVTRHARDLCSQAGILPLGDAWSGMCYAEPGSPQPPSEADLHTLCALGYARGRCRSFREDDPGADAVRFTISADRGASLQLSYVLERDHHPFAHGSLEYTLSPAALPDAPSMLVGRQAEAYVESYLRRKSRAPAR